MEEQDYALRHFISILHTVVERSYILLDGVGVALKYVLDRMVAEFAAAAVFLGKNLPENQVGGDIDCSVFTQRIEEILQEFHPEVFGYYSRCLDHGHKHFVWTGPKLKILPRLEEMAYVVPITEMLDLPTCSIYDVVLEATPPPTKPPPPGKRQEPEDESDREDGRPKRRRL